MSESVVKLKRSHEVLVQGCTLYIGRECSRGGWNLQRSKWHNPFRPSRYPDGDVCQMYEDYVRENPHLWNSLFELEGHTLGCWCHPKPCHGHVLLKLLNERRRQIVGETPSEMPDISRLSIDDSPLENLAYPPSIGIPDKVSGKIDVIFEWVV